jgi:hypothetical protein
LVRAVERGELSSMATGEILLEALDAVVGHRCFIEKLGLGRRYLVKVVDLFVDGCRPRARRSPTRSR